MALYTSCLGIACFVLSRPVTVSDDLAFNEGGPNALLLSASSDVNWNQALQCLAR